MDQATPNKTTLQEQLEKFQKEYTDMTAVRVGEKVSSLTSLAKGPATDTILALLSEATDKGMMPKHALQLGDDTMEAIYSQGYNLYNQGRYQEASYIFRLLMLLDYMTTKYILGLGACMHRMKNYKDAANIYLLCSTLDTTNPLPHFHAADCYIQLDVPTLAIFSLGLAITAAGDQPQYAIVKERASLMREALDKQLKERVAKITEAKAENKETQAKTK
jgi:type III secretion system low calcium response chaperone LcrH/SycD